MKELLISINKDQPKYRALAESLRTAIRGGRLLPGEALPSTRQLAKIFKMDRHTVMNALSELIAEGWVTAETKRAYFVNRSLPETYLRPYKIIEKTVSAQPAAYHFAREVHIDDYDGENLYKHAFPSGMPDVRLFPLRELKSFFSDALRSSSVLSYGDPAGHHSLMEQINVYLRRIRGVKDRSIIISNGSQEALFMLAQLFIKPGDHVAVEGLGYPPAMEAFRFAGAKLCPIALDGEGLVIEDLRKQLKKKKIRLLYVTPLHQYPTTVTLSATRRLQLYQIAVEHGLFIIEDDYDHEFHYASQPIAPLASFDPAGRVFYVSTFSKVLFPSARVGFMALPPEVAKQVARMKRLSSRQNEQILQSALARWMASGGLERHMRRMCRCYEERRNALLSDLAEIKQAGVRMSWVDPDGGMALWLNLHRDTTLLAEKARARSLLLNPESRFRVDGRPGTHLRVGFSGFSPRENRESLQKLTDLLRGR